jgi:SAM-dependent methyltransferase
VRLCSSGGYASSFSGDIFVLWANSLFHTMYNKDMFFNLLLAILAFLIFAFLLIYSLWLIIPILSGLPWVPTSQHRIRKALELARVQPGEVVYDLGSGDGRVLLTAVRDFGARAIGIEISPLHCLAARWLARFNNLSDQVSIRQGDFYTANLEEADVVFAFMTSAQAVRLRPTLPARLRKGARVVTASFDFDGWLPAKIDQENLVFLYEMPPAPGSLGLYLEQKESMKP